MNLIRVFSQHFTPLFHVDRYRYGDRESSIDDYGYIFVHSSFSCTDGAEQKTSRTS